MRPCRRALGRDRDNGHLLQPGAPLWVRPGPGPQPHGALGGSLSMWIGWGGGRGGGPGVYVECGGVGGGIRGERWAYRDCSGVGAAQQRQQSPAGQRRALTMDGVAPASGPLCALRIATPSPVSLPLLDNPPPSLPEPAAAQRADAAARPWHAARRPQPNLVGRPFYV
jgi:hypothetical protein